MSGFARCAVLACVSVVTLLLSAESRAQSDRDAPAPRKKPVDVFNHIPGESTVLKRKPAGTVVKKGECVVELDDTQLREALTNQKLGIKAAEAAYRSAKMNREVAEIGVKEFVDGISKEDIEMADADIAQATAERLRAEDKAKLSKLPEDEQALGDAQLAEQKAKAKKEILVKYTDAKDLKELEGEVFKAKEVERVTQAALQRETSKADRLRRDIEACKAVAPTDGVVGYLRPIDEEDTFQQGEVMFRIFPQRARSSDARPK